MSVSSRPRSDAPPVRPEGTAAAPVETRIRSRYAALTPAERRLADLILNFPGELASYSATELAALAGVSKAAATRLFRRLGYTSYQQARREARDAQRWGSPLYLNTARDGGAEPATALAAHHECELANLARTLDALAGVDVEAIVDRLCTARRVVLFGVRNSYMLASYARWQLIQVRDDVVLLPNAGETLAEHLAGLDGNDLLLAVGGRADPVPHGPDGPCHRGARHLDRSLRGARRIAVRQLCIGIERSALPVHLRGAPHGPTGAPATAAHRGAARAARGFRVRAPCLRERALSSAVVGTGA